MLNAIHKKDMTYEVIQQVNHGWDDMAGNELHDVAHLVLCIRLKERNRVVDKRSKKREGE